LGVKPDAHSRADFLLGIQLGGHQVAYLNLLASVPESQVERLRLDPALLVTPSLILGVSHLLAYSVRVQPLGGLLGRALDGGQPVHAQLWHPLRPPIFHPPAVVAELAGAIGQAWAEVLDARPVPDADRWADEIEPVLRMFRRAADSGECVVSALEPPGDQERASRVRLPWSRRLDL
jgi:hypothetical protein